MNGGQKGGDRPVLAAEGLRLKRGWYMAEVLIESDQSYLDTSFTLMRSCGRKPLRLQLPARSGRVAKRLIWCARGGEQLLFSPAACKCDYQIKRLTLVRVSGVFARDRMKVRLARRFLTVPRQVPDRWARYNATFSPNGARVSYQDWINNVEPGLLRLRPRHIGTKPQLCLLMPVGDGDSLENVQSAVDSVRAQCWRGWRLVLFLATPGPEIRAALEGLADGDSRVQLREFSEWRAVLDEGTDEYHLVFPPCAVLSPRALTCLRYAIHGRPKGKIFYADEDRLSESGRRVEPRFKPAWNPDLLYSQNYIGEFLLFAPGVLASAGPLQVEVEPAWDLGLLLGALRGLENPAAEIVHVPRVLFHRVAAEMAGGYLQSCRKLIVEHFAKTGHDKVQVDISEDGTVLHTSWPVPGEEPLVSLLIPTRDMLSILRQCVDSILEKTTYRNFEVLVLDNQSCEPETLEYFSRLEALSNVRVLPYDAPFNYSAINNFGVRHARGEIIGLINNDIEVISPNWLTEMVGHVLRPDVGCVGAKLYYGDGRIQHAGVVVGLGGLAGHGHKFYQGDAAGYMGRLLCTQNFSAVTAACLLMRKGVYEDVGGLNEKDLAVAFNDVDLCLKALRVGYRNVWTPWAELYHHESVSRGIDNTREKRARFDREAKYLKQTWLKKFDLDPCYSPLLTHSCEDFSFGLNEKRAVPLARCGMHSSFTAAVKN